MRVKDIVHQYIDTGASGVSLVATLVLVSLGIALLAAAQSAALPDGRVYEQVSPPNKNGNIVPPNAFGLAAEVGDAVVFPGSGAMGDSVSSINSTFVAKRTHLGWVTSSAIPRDQAPISISGITGSPWAVVPSSDFSRFLFTAIAPYVSTEPLEERSSSNIFLSDSSAHEPLWVARPMVSDPIPALGHNNQEHDALIAGGTPNLSTVYFTYSGTLLPQDSSRVPYIGNGQGEKEDAPWGFYEWNTGILSEAGELPDGTLDQFGAVPAAMAEGATPAATSQERREPEFQAQVLNNEVSTDGSRAFFVSPDPIASEITNREVCEREGPCSDAPPELYVRKTASTGAKSTVLVSRSQLPEHEGEPAPSGIVGVNNAQTFNGHSVGATDTYASPDGSHAFFRSASRLTKEAPEDTAIKTYDFNIETGKLTYLPEVSGPIVASSKNGTDLIFESTMAMPFALDLWMEGANGGEVITIAQLPTPTNVGTPFNGLLDVSGGRATPDGSVFIFRTNSPITGFNNAGGFAELYRYSRIAGLSCVSCPPAGVNPSGDARVSYDNAEPGRTNGVGGNPMTTRDTRVISADGQRIFFDSPDALVPADINGKRDVYEWENGNVYLISSGKSVDEATILDSSVGGEDVFFRTDEGLVPGDTDNSYDVYDARIPRAGDNTAPVAVPCQGDVCQGPSSVPSLLGSPPSALFSGAGNLTPTQAKSPDVTRLTRAQKLAKALRVCRAKRTRTKRRRCEAQAKRASGLTPGTKKASPRAK